MQSHYNSNMLLCLPDSDQRPDVVESLGLAVRSFGAVVPYLDPTTASWVFLLPDSALDEPGWPALRARLANAHRSFVVFGPCGASAPVVRAMRDGAFDYLFTNEEGRRWNEALEKAAASQQLWLDFYGSGPSGITLPSDLVGTSAAIEAVRRMIDRVGPTPASVLVVGESGTGKERVAAALHRASGRKGSFLAINCAAIPKDLLEAELFGAEKGAFTGAMQTREGLVEQAREGTLFLDEIGEMDLALQPKLLRFLETRQARRLGGKHDYAVDVRILAATNRDLEQEIDRHKFRADLFYRLAEITVKLPPLRNHPEDIPQLAAHFLDQANERLGKHFLSLEPELVSAMMAYSWPGNVRELRAAIHLLAILHEGPVLRREWWAPPEPRNALANASSTLDSAPPTAAGPIFAPSPLGRLSRAEKFRRAEELLRQSGRDQTWTAAQLGVHPTTLFRWIQSGKVKGNDDR